MCSLRNGIESLLNVSVEIVRTLHSFRAIYIFLLIYSNFLRFRCLWALFSRTHRISEIFPFVFGWDVTKCLVSIPLCAKLKITFENILFFLLLLMFRTLCDLFLYVFLDVLYIYETLILVQDCFRAKNIRINKSDLAIRRSHFIELTGIYGCQPTTWRFNFYWLVLRSHVVWKSWLHDRAFWIFKLRTQYLLITLVRR